MKNKVVITPSYFAAPGLHALVFIKNTHLKLGQITNTVCDFLCVDKEIVFKRTRRREVVEARQICMHFAKGITGESLKNIGQFYGGRDHTTVIHSCNTVKDLSETDPQYLYRLEAIANLF